MPWDGPQVMEQLLVSVPAEAQESGRFGCLHRTAAIDCWTGRRQVRFTAMTCTYSARSEGFEPPTF